MRLLDTLRRPAPPDERSVFPELSLSQYFALAGNLYPLGVQTLYPRSGSVTIPTDLSGFVETVHRKSPVVASAVAKRAGLMSEIRFVWRNNRLSSTPGRLFGTPALGVLERPSEDVTTPVLLAAAEVDVSYAGVAFFHRPRPNVVRRLRPDWVQCVYSSDVDPDNPLEQHDLRLVGFAYIPGGHDWKRAQALAFEDVAYWAPEPGPLPGTGWSWVQGLVAEITADRAATEYRTKFYENGATPNLVFLMDKEVRKETLEAFREMNERATAGVRNAYKNMYVGGGADVRVVGANLDGLSFRDSQGGDETRIALRSQVPAAILGIREGMQGSSLNSGNYTAQRRQWADIWFAPHGRGLCKALERIVPPPGPDAELSFDRDAIVFLQEDGQDAANISQTQAQAIRALVEAGYEPDAAVEAVKTGDLAALTGRHTGVFSVQLQPPTSGQQPDA